MKYLKISTLLALTAVLIIGCAKQDETEIQALLENSPYIGQGITESTTESDNASANLTNPLLLTDTTFYDSTVDWSRRVFTPINRVYNISVTGDSADVTITSYLYGTPGQFEVDPDYGFTVDNAYGSFVRATADSALQKVKLVLEENGWRILSLTAANLYTVGLVNPINITEIKARVNSRNYEFVINSPETYFTKDELPTFLPTDIVEVTVTLEVTGDSAWPFLHHGAGHKPAFGLRHHYKNPFYRTSTNTFTRSWEISADSIANNYGVRHTAVDVVGWQALFGDSDAAYYARVWALPYIVREADQEPPPDDYED